MGGTCTGIVKNWGGRGEDKEVQGEMEDCLLEVLEGGSPGIEDQKFAKGKAVE